MTQTTKRLQELIKQYEAIQKEYKIVKEKLDNAQAERDRVGQEELQLSKQILEVIGVDTNNFRGGLYNFTDYILPFLKTLGDKR